MITSDVLVYILYWFGFGLIHSILASKNIKSKMIASFFSPQGYRIFYNVINTLLLLLVGILIPYPDDLITEISQFSTENFLGYFVSFFGIIIFLYGLSEWNIRRFLGFTDPQTDQYLITDGPYKISRHPVYTGAIMIFFGFILITFNNFTLSLLIGAGGYFAVGSYFEERKLLDTFGKDYMQYRKLVGRLFPTRKKHLNYLINGDRNG